MPQLFALAIVACALLLRVAVPQGWMPVATPGGWRITICTGTGPMAMAMPAMPGMKAAPHGPRDGGHGPADHGAADHPCAFSSLALALDEPPLPALAWPATVTAAEATRLASVIGVGRGLAAPPPPATGPPAAV